MGRVYISLKKCKDNSGGGIELSLWSIACEDVMNLDIFFACWEAILHIARVLEIECWKDVMHCGWQQVTTKVFCLVLSLGFIFEGEMQLG